MSIIARRLVVGLLLIAVMAAASACQNRCGWRRSCGDLPTAPVGLEPR